MTIAATTALPSPALHECFQPDAISSDAHEVNTRLAVTLAALAPPDNLAETRKAYSSGLLGLPASPKSLRTREVTIPGPAGPLKLRILVPENVRGAYLHFHGGAWTVGSNDTSDGILELFGSVAGMATISVGYRLAPENPFPAAVDDGVAAALWLIENAQAEFDTSWLSIGGESAGANLAALTLLRLRYAGKSASFKAANMLFGAFDLSLTPSMRAAKGTAFIDRPSMEQAIAGFAAGVDLRDPTISPLYADLRNLPPALFTIGTIDPLVDDTLFMHMRWQAAGNRSMLAVYPGGPHGFNALDGDLARSANLAMAHFLRAESR